MKRIIQSLLVASAVALFGVACTDRDTGGRAERAGEDIGEGLGRAGDRAERGVDSVVQDVRRDDQPRTDVTGDPERSRIDEEREEYN